MAILNFVWDPGGQGYRVDDGSVDSSGKERERLADFIRAINACDDVATLAWWAKRTGQTWQAFRKSNPTRRQALRFGLDCEYILKQIAARAAVLTKGKGAGGK